MPAATRRRALFTLLAVVALLLAAPAYAQIKIDDFMTPLPPNPDLPVSLAQTIFVGSRCDGSSCPPGTMVSHLTQDQCSQTGLTGVMGGQRDARIVRTTGTAGVDVWEGWFCVSHNSLSSSRVYVKYGVTTEMNANLAAGDASAIEITAMGDMYSGPRPVPLTITVTSRRGTPQEATASVTQSLVNDGLYTFPFSGFTGVDFADVDAVSLDFNASAVSAVDFCVYDFQTNGTPVATARETWGRVKHLYR